MRRQNELVTVALWLGLVILALAGLLTVGMCRQRTEPVEESRPYYTYRVVGGVEEDVAHVIVRETAHEE